ILFFHRQGNYFFHNTTSFLLLRGGILHQVTLTFLLCNKMTLLYCGDSIFYAEVFYEITCFLNTLLVFLILESNSFSKFP
ncbi:MAG: hypothetical protein NC904_03640, partial [Candidatus Omnitrophica bacterium]|nr:hypothetical protein [Candidatus Omnitrophota bacterium]